MFTQDELALFQRVFDKLCKEQRLALKDSEQRDQLATLIIRTFKTGVSDEYDLWSSLSKRRKIRA
ncbi:RNA-binding protein [Mesorhizobium sp.]|uniref:RNA-binding protein n=1 Tax=Mesorhizobium sp. TaxID=1871066 RepID=UPI0025F3DA97|nr:RNA-binding protein [Mesorhizobium sp.]